MSWEQINNLNFVREVEKWPCLYNYDMIEYSRKDFTDAAWDEVGKKTKMTKTACKEKWKNLRTVFVRHMKPSSSSGRVKKSKYYLTDSMQFILPFVKTLNGLGNNTNSLYTTDEHEEVETNVFSPKTEIVEMDEEIMPAERPQINCKGLPGLKQEQESVNEEMCGNSYDERPTPDMETRKMFLLSLLDEVNQLSDGQMRQFKRKVLTLIDDIVMQ